MGETDAARAAREERKEGRSRGNAEEKKGTKWQMGVGGKGAHRIARKLDDLRGGRRDDGGGTQNEGMAVRPGVSHICKLLKRSEKCGRQAQHPPCGAFR